MKFFGKVRAAAKAAAAKVFSERTRFDASVSKKPSNSKSISFTMDVDTARAGAKYQAAMTIFFDKALTDDALRRIGQGALKEVQATLDPISRTGTLKRSFNYRINSADNSVTIYSNEPRAASIATGVKTVPSSQSLIAWMAQKPEFSGYDEGTKQRIAFNIQERIRKGKTPGGNSDLRTLRPVGKREYDYLSVAMEQISKSIESDLNELVQGL